MRDREERGDREGKVRRRDSRTMEGGGSGDKIGQEEVQRRNRGGTLFNKTSMAEPVSPVSSANHRAGLTV